MNEQEKPGTGSVAPVNGWYLLSREKALEFIGECKERSLGILGIDAFFIREGIAIPSPENSLDFACLPVAAADRYEVAAGCIKQGAEDLYFEVFCANDAFIA